jgi:thiol-disulfide isomerase/thioredoxin
VSCDKVEPPYIENPVIIDTNNNEGTKRVLIEEFTGHLCPNCPEAAHITKVLENNYPGKITVIAIHAGNFAIPISPNYMTDFRTSAGNILNNSFGVYTYPSGMVDRISVLGSQLISPNDWGNIVNERLARQLQIDLKITSQYNENNRSFQCRVEAKTLDVITNPLMLVALFTEDSIIDYQKNNNPLYGPTPDIPNYTHNHVLRDCITNVWGDTLCDNCIVNNVYYKNYSFEIPNNWNADFVNLVVYCYDSATQEVLQVIEKRIK